MTISAVILWALQDSYDSSNAALADFVAHQSLIIENRCPLG